jgi:hypothetical protein
LSYAGKTRKRKEARECTEYVILGKGERFGRGQSLGLR